MSWKVKFFQTARGEYPVKDFIERLDQSTYTKVLRSITLLEAYGPFLKPPHSKKVRDDLYELRIVGKEAIRIFYTQKHDEYYLVHVFKKKRQKIPSREIQTALDRAGEIT